MITKFLCLATFLHLELILVNSQWCGSYDQEYSQPYIVYNPYGQGYDDYYKYTDAQMYGSYPQQYSGQPIVIIVNNEQEKECDLDDFLSLLFPKEEKCKEVCVPYAVPVAVPIRCCDMCTDSAPKVCECVCTCECHCSDYCPRCDSCNDCGCKKKEKCHKCKCKKNDCRKSDCCNCSGNLYHKMY